MASFSARGTFMIVVFHHPLATTPNLPWWFTPTIIFQIVSEKRIANYLANISISITSPGMPIT
jgi:hypothetical protein